jgi:predicted esterase
MDRTISVLPRRQCSDRLVPMLRRAGYNVNYSDFSGGHEVPPEIRYEARAWFLTPAGVETVTLAGNG